MDVCWITETPIQHSTSVIAVRSSDTTYLSIHISGDLVSRAGGQTSVWFALSMRVERALFDWIPVDSRFCSVRLDDFVRYTSSQLSCHCLFIIFVHAATDYSSPETKDQLCQTYPHYSKMCVQQTLWSLVAISPLKNGISETHFLSPTIGSTSKVNLSKSVRTTDCSWRIPIFVIKSEVGSPGAFLRLHSFRLKLTILPSDIGGVNKLRVVDHFDPHL